MREIKLIFDNNENIDLDKFQIVSGEGEDVSIITNYPHRVIYNINSEDDLKFIRSKGYFCEEKTEKGYVIIRKLNSEIHVVRPCETLGMIARKYNTKEKVLIEKNHLKTNKIFIGQNLFI